MDPVTPDEIAAKSAADVLAALRNCGAKVRRGLAVVAKSNGLAVEVRVRPLTHPGPRGRTVEREEAIVEVVRAAGRRLTGKEIRRAMADAGMECGASTIEKDLARLSASGRLVNVRGGDGYGLPEWARAAPVEVPRLFPEPDEWDRRAASDPAA